MSVSSTTTMTSERRVTPDCPMCHAPHHDGGAFVAALMGRSTESGLAVPETAVDPIALDAMHHIMRPYVLARDNAPNDVVRLAIESQIAEAGAGLGLLTATCEATGRAQVLDELFERTGHFHVDVGKDAAGDMHVQIEHEPDTALPATPTPPSGRVN